MKSIGIEISSKGLFWIMIDGNNKSGLFIKLEGNGLKLPVAHDSEIQNLLELKRIVASTISSAGAEIVGFTKATAGCSPIRCKIECMVEMACLEALISCKSLAPQTVSTAKKRKVLQIAGDTLFNRYNSGDVLDPKYLHDAAFCAWCAFN